MRNLDNKEKQIVSGGDSRSLSVPPLFPPPREPAKRPQSDPKVWVDPYKAPIIGGV